MTPHVKFKITTASTIPTANACKPRFRNLRPVRTFGREPFAIAQANDNSAIAA